MKNINVKLTGSKKEGFIITVINHKDEFMDDIALNEEELLEIYKAIGKKLKI